MTARAVPTVSCLLQLSQFTLLDSKDNINNQVMQPPLMFNKLSIAGSLIGGLVETQECIDFCAEKGVEPEIELVCNSKASFSLEISNMKIKSLTSNFSLG